MLFQEICLWEFRLVGPCRGISIGVLTPRAVFFFLARGTKPSVDTSRGRTTPAVPARFKANVDGARATILQLSNLSPRGEHLPKQRAAWLLETGGGTYVGIDLLGFELDTFFMQRGPF